MSGVVCTGAQYESVTNTLYFLKNYSINFGKYRDDTHTTSSMYFEYSPKTEIKMSKIFENSFFGFSVCLRVLLLAKRQNIYTLKIKKKKKKK